MSWKEVSPMEEIIRFVMLAQSARFSVSELCEQFVNGSVLDNVISPLSFLFPLAVEQMVDITRRAHLQSLRDPFHRHRCFRTQAHRHRHLSRSSFGVLAQVCFLPPPVAASEDVIHRSRIFHSQHRAMPGKRHRTPPMCQYQEPTRLWFAH